MERLKLKGKPVAYDIQMKGKPQKVELGEEEQTSGVETKPELRDLPPGANRPVSTMTSRPVQTAEEDEMQRQEAFETYKGWGANAVRYGGPVAAGLVSGGWSIPAQIGFGGAASAGSEITARQIERAGTDPKLDSLWQDIKAGGVAGGIDMGVSTILHGLGKGVLWAAKKVLLPKNMKPEVEAAQAILARPDQKAKARRWWKWTGNEPFSLSPHQLNPEEKGFVYHLESLARSGSGAGKFQRFDDRNAAHIQDAIVEYVTKRADNSSAPEWGAFINRVLGKTNDAGELFKPVEAYKTYLYSQYKDALASYPDASIDGTQLLNFFRNTKNTDLLKFYRDLANLDILPSKLRGSVETSQEAYQMIGGKMKKVKVKTPVDEQWKKLNVMDVDETLHQMNALWEDGKEKERWNKLVKLMKENLSKPYDDFLRDKPDLKSYKETANKYYGKMQDTMNNSVIKTIRDKMIDKPSTVLTMFDPSSGDVRAKYDNLMAFKKAMYFSGDAPSPVKGVGYGMGRQEAEKMWERDVLRPLRFSFVAGLTDSNGVINADKALARITNLETKRTPEFLHELFGGQKQVDEAKKLFGALKYQQATRPNGSIFIQLKTAAAFTSTGAGIWSYVTSDDPKRAAAGVAGSVAIMMGPAALAKTLTNPRLTRALYEGATDQRIFTGMSTKLMMALRKIGQQKAASEIMRDIPSGDAAQFYSFAPMEQEQDE